MKHGFYWRRHTRHTAAALLYSALMVFSTAQAAPSCRMEQAATLPLSDADHTVSSPAHIDGHPVSLMVDTGSEGSLLTPEALVRFHLHTDPDHHTAILGPDAHPHLVPNVLVQQLALGNVHREAITVPMGALPPFPTVQPPLLGLIGMDLLGQYDLELDLAHHRMALWTVQVGSTLCQHPPLWSHLWLNLPAQRYHGRFLVPFTLDNHPGLALIDSGSRSTVVSTYFAHQLGITDAQLAHDPGGEIAGLGLKEHSYHWHQFHLLRIGTEDWTTPTLTVAPVHDHADILLGAEWFQTHRLWLSAATGHVFVQGVEGH
ncbi:retroviral-like aspartic protease family protein [Saccharibacter floricola]|uniref:retroviral-like aspartic protease family protein n=1 Tax=Saccharibacter floricola TaxID=231053 RepID=UPI000378BE41|nr:retroviral-like aspartic protease family protein [Saccharibacter floricola]